MMANSAREGMKEGGRERNKRSFSTNHNRLFQSAIDGVVKDVKKPQILSSREFIESYRAGKSNLFFT